MLQCVKTYFILLKNQIFPFIDSKKTSTEILVDAPPEYALLLHLFIKYAYAV